MTNSRTPQLRAISSNTCPNAEPRSLSDVATCDLAAMTTWGYCRECWDRGAVPARWADQVDGAIARLRP